MHLYKMLKSPRMFLVQLPKLLAEEQVPRGKLDYLFLKVVPYNPDFYLSNFHSKQEDWNAIVRKNTVIRNPIGSKSEALQRQQSRQSLRRHIMNAQAQGLMMDTDNLLQYNPKLADVSHTTRIAYAKFMTTKIKKEIKFEDEQTEGEKVRIENELERTRGARALNRFKANAGILKKTEVPKNPEVILQNGDLTVVEIDKTSAVSPPASPVNEQNVSNLQNFPTSIERDFRARTPIEEESETPSDLPSTPRCSLDVPDSKVLSPRVLSPPSSSSSEDHKVSPCPSPKKSLDPEKSPRKENAPAPIPRSRSPSCANIPEIITPEPSEPNVPKSRKSSQDSSGRLSPRPPVSPSISISGSDKGKSKITGKTLTGWL